ncbi:uncharacterized protein PV09_01718 [Verruconis gallopava]|uniref:Peroxisomal membrane protein 4 n=1 Tax=Verruconis gallopava TaxID=253628 RepID=A0A0D2B966_9PEZI|nr:uncharacterized protein PV09_01718 [Verruconis gallopava]KIW07794.1 hypothetical protein PV09_01718 [Verruconis gallopava]
MDLIKSLEASLEKIVLDPKYHDVFMLVKAVRNGVVYGTKVRFPHALVMMFLFRSGTFREKMWLVIKATRMHARNLGLFAFIYKSTCLALRALQNGKEGHYDTFLAGLLGGYLVFGRTIRNSVSQQIVIYIFARVVLGIAKLLVKSKGEAMSAVPGGGGGFGLVSSPKVREWLAKNGWVAFASLSWASVMYLFRWHPEDLQPSLRSSMSYIYVQSDHWDGLRTLIWHNK